MIFFQFLLGSIAVGLVHAWEQNYFSGIAVSNFVNNNGASACRTQDDWNAIASAVKSNGFKSIRIVGFDCDALDLSSSAAAAQGLTILAGLYISGTVADGQAQLDADLTTFRNAYGKYGNGLYVGLTVGNEVNDSPENIAGAVQHAKTVLGDLTVDISTVHVWVTVRDNPILCQNVNFIGANAHAFYDGNTAAQDAGNFLQNTVIPSLTQACPNAHIIISETGWPSDGSPNGAAVPSFENEASALASLNCAAKAEGAVSVYAFEYDDSTWKASQGADASEQSFGLYVKQQPTLLTAIAAVLMISC